MYNLFLNTLDNTFVIISDDLLEDVKGLIKFGLIKLIDSNENMRKLIKRASDERQKDALSVFSLN